MKVCIPLVIALKKESTSIALQQRALIRVTVVFDYA
jgi:hypothetical protein